MPLDHLYSKKWELTFEQGDQTVLKTLKFMHAGVIVQIMAKQTSGSNVAFDLTLYNSAVDPSDPDELEKITDKLSATAGNTIELYASDGYMYTFRNSEGTISVPVRKIYALWEFGSAIGAGGATFELQITCKPHI